jgi:superfamily II DNA or RNA helicase
MESIYEAIQEASTRPLWSRGVQLARAGAVSIDERRDHEITLCVATRGGLVAPEVTLHPNDEEWECSCSSVEDPCEHVVAAVIAIRQAEKSGRRLPTQGEGRGRIVYELEERGGDLQLTRAIEFEGRRSTLRGSLTAAAAGHTIGPDFVATPADLAIERILSARPAQATSRPALTQLLDKLAGTERVFLAGRPIRIESDPLGMNARVVDAPGGVRLFIEQDRRIDRAFRNGVVQAGDALHPIARNRLTGRELADLPRGRFYSDDDLAMLVTEVIPDLEERISLEVETAKLPKTKRGERPRIRIELHRDRDGLAVLPTLVYGQPAVARIDAGRLVHLGQGEVPIRDQAAENAAITKLRNELGLRPGHRVHLTASEAIDFAARLEGTSMEVLGDAHHDFQLRGSLNPTLQIDDDRVMLDFSVGSVGSVGSNEAVGSVDPALAEDRAGDARKEPASAGGANSEAVLRAWAAGESVVALDGGGFATLPADWLAKYGDRLADLLSALDSRGRVARHALPDLALLCEDLDQPPPAALEGLRPLLEGFEGIPRAELPAGLEDVLRPYQRQGVDWLVFLRRAGLGALLADDMGLGKTLQALCAVEGRTLVVAPTSVLHGWMREIERFRPELRYALYHGPGRKLDPTADITITSYALLRQDRKELTEPRWDCVVLDEAQMIKNPESQVARAALELDAKARFALTGTPVENRLEELWSQLHFLNPGLLGGRSQFKERYARPISEGDTDIAARLRQRIRPFLLRRLKKEVAPDLPPLSEIILDCELSSEERAVYDSVRAATVRSVVDQLRSGGNVMAALEALLRLRQAACHSSLVPGQEAENDSSSKLETLFARLEEAVADGHKALVFSQWTSFLDRVEPGLRERGIPWLRLDGSTRNRGEIVDRFQSENGDGEPVMLLSLRAGGTGLTLTAADHVFLLDPWWNPAVEAQAADRAHRIGQDRPVIVHRLIARDTVEEGILRLHSRKRALADAALEDADGSSRLTRDDLLELLENA